MKNTWLTLLGLNLLTAPLAATAQQFGDFSYSSDGAAITITGYTGPGGAVNIPSTITDLPVTRIGDEAFRTRTSLTRITIPSSVTTIGDSAFHNCTSLSSVTIPESVTYIGIGAFEHCNSLTSVTIPSSVTIIRGYAFSDCYGLVAFVVDPACPAYCSLDGVLFNKDLTMLWQCPGGRSGGYAVPGSVTSIGFAAFKGCTSLTSVAIPSSVTNIWHAAFNACTKLTAVVIPSSVSGLGSDAFMSCLSLTNVTIPASITSIEPGTFLDCGSLPNVTIPGSVTNWANYPARIYRIRSP